MIVPPCDFCLSCDAAQAERATHIVTVRGPDGKLQRVPACNRHRLAAQSYRERAGIRMHEPLRAMEAPAVQARVH